MPNTDQNLTLPFFPLPNFVLFPNVFAPLHIFEPRYRRLVDRAIDSDGLFCIGTLVGDWKPCYYEDAPFYGHGCICKIVDYEKVGSNRYNIMVHGTTVAELAEVESDALFRQVAATPVPTTGADAVHEMMLTELRETLLGCLSENQVDGAELAPHLENMEPDKLIDCIGFLAPLADDVKLSALSAETYSERCRVLLEGMIASC